MASLVLIADSHVSREHGNDVEFRDLLKALADSPYGVVFLGDIIDLWIALPGYEHALHEHFVTWCRNESKRRTVGFVEGNHEFFLVEGHHDAFSFVASDEYMDAQHRLFVHGDMVNRGDWSYRVFRRVTKNPFIHWLERVAPIGPPISRFLKKHLNARREGLPKCFPEAAVAEYADRWLNRGAAAIYMGHFHGRHCLSREGNGHCEVVPAWRDCGKVVLLEDGSREGRVYHWRDLPVEP